MRTRTVIFSLIFHAAIAATLLGAAGKKIGRKATQVVLAEEKKKAKPEPPKPPPPPPPKAAPKPVEHKVASVTKAATEPVAKAAAPVAVATALTMTNDDGPGGIALAPAPKAAAATPGTKVASATTEARKQRLREATTTQPGEEAPCAEEPTKPVVISQQPDIELTASARAEGIEGRLILSLTIGPDGTVTAVRVTKSLSAEMDTAAEAAVRQWRFKPAMACGKPVEGKFNLGRTFELGD